MSWEVVQDLKRRRKDVEFWANITPLIAPFNNPLFSEIKPQLKNTQIGVRKFSPNRKQIENSRSRSIFKDQLHDKETQTHFYETSLVKSDQTTQTQFYCNCFQRNEQKSDRLLVTGKSKLEGVVRISKDSPFKHNANIKIEPGPKLRLCDVQHSKSCKVSETIPIKKSYVLVEKLRLGKETSNTVGQTPSYSMNTEDIALDSLVAREDCKKQFRSDEKLNMIPRVFLRRVGESVDFFRSLDLRPKWKNSDVFQSPVRPKKLSRFRKGVK